MDDGRLDRLEQALVLHARGRKRMDPHPDVMAGLAAGVMREVRARAEAKSDFWGVFVLAGWRFAPAGALAATAAFAWAQASERLLGQALMSLSLTGGAGYLLAGLLP